jgi:arylsulfatase
MNVILFLSDALRPDHLACYGYKRQTSPFIDSLARQGTIFRNAIACASFTMPSHKAIFSSVYDRGGNLEKLKPGIETIAEILAEKGFETAAFVSNAITSKESGLGKGFSFFEEGLENIGNLRPEKGRTAKQAVHSAIKWIEANKEKQFFCFVQVVDTHGPYTPPKKFANLFQDKLFEEQNRKKLPFSQNDLGYKAIPRYQRTGEENKLGQYVARYDASVRFVDQELGRLWKKLQQLNLDRKTALLITSDHGESLGEHDWFFCHGIDLYEESIRVPLILHIPNGKAVVVEEQASHLDIAPTILSLLNIEKPKQMQGLNLLPLAEGKQLRREQLFFEINSDIHSKLVNTIVSGVRTNKWKYLETKNVEVKGASTKKAFGRIVAGTKKSGFSVLKTSLSKARHVLPRMLKTRMGTVTKELYDLENDPEEKKNLVGKKQAIANELSRKLQRWREEQNALASKAGKASKVEATQKMRERLRKLGYFE